MTLRPFRARALALALIAAPLVVQAIAIQETAWAVDPEDQLSDPALEARARNISRDLRCLVCAGQTIDESSSPVAHALRVMVRERLAAGDTDEQVLAAVEQRYGEYALLKPRFTPQNFLLWTAPFIVLAFGAFAAWRYAQANTNAAEPAPLTDAEREALEKLKAG